jgi:hypothetical protein
MLPFGRSVDWSRISNSGQLLLQRALDWGMVASAVPGGCDGTYRDEFNTVNYSSSDGTLGWTTDWLEAGDDGTAASGDIRVTTDLSDTALMVNNKSRSIEREANLAGAGSATLMFDYRRNGLDDYADLVTVMVSGDGGGSWFTLDEFRGASSDTAYQAASHDISSYSGPNTRIRFISSNFLGKKDGVYFDNVQITCAP